MHFQPADSDGYSPIFHNYADVVGRTTCQCVCHWIFLPQWEEVRTCPSSLIVMIVTARRIIASFNQARTLWLWTADIYSWCFTEMDTDVVIKCGKRFMDVQTVRGTERFLVWAENDFSKHTRDGESSLHGLGHLGVAKEVLWALCCADVDFYLLQMWSAILLSMFPFKKSVILNHGCTKGAFFHSCDCCYNLACWGRETT